MRGVPPWRGDASGTARTRVQLPDRHLDTFISVLVATQQFVLVGRIASARLAAQAPWLAQAFAVLSVITFDVRVLAGANRPECAPFACSPFLQVQFAPIECRTGTLTFVAFFWATRALAAQPQAPCHASSACERSLCSRAWW